MFIRQPDVAHFLLVDMPAKSRGSTRNQQINCLVTQLRLLASLHERTRINGSRETWLFGTIDVCSTERAPTTVENGEYYCAYELREILSPNLLPRPEYSGLKTTFTQELHQKRGHHV